MALIIQLLITQIKRYFFSSFFLQIILLNLILILIFKICINFNHMFNLFWVINLFFIFFCLDNLFQKDFLDHCLELFYLSKVSLYFYIVLQYFFFWFFYQLPFLLFMIYCYAFSIYEIYALILGSLSLTLLSGFINSLTLYLIDKNFIYSIMVYPLYLPILIYGTNLEILKLFMISLILFLIIPLLTSYILLQNIK